MCPSVCPDTSRASWGGEGGLKERLRRREGRFRRTQPAGFGGTIGGPYVSTVARGAQAPIWPPTPDGSPQHSSTNRPLLCSLRVRPFGTRPSRCPVPRCSGGGALRVKSAPPPPIALRTSPSRGTPYAKPLPALVGQCKARDSLSLAPYGLQHVRVGGLCVCVCVCVRACARACVRACVRVRARARAVRHLKQQLNQNSC